MLSLIFFYIFVIPLCVLLHEIGHGIGVVCSSKSHTHIYLGPYNNENKENFRLGRFHFHLQWSFIGFASWNGDLNKHQRLAALAGGPIMSLVLMFIFGTLANFSPYEHLRTIITWTAVYFLIQFVVTIIPITYPRWWVGYSGYPSDGLQIFRLFKHNN